MKSLSAERTMTVKEVAEALCVTDRTIRNYADKLRNDLSGVKSSQGGYLFTEADVTKIKLTLQKNQHLGQVSELPKTDLEKKLLVKQAFDILMQDLEVEKAKNKVLKVKADVADLIADTTGKTGLSAAGKQITGHPNLFCKWLEDSKILYRLQGVLVPRADLQDRGYFVVKTTVDSLTNKSYYQTFLTPKGMAWVTALWLKKNTVVVNDQASELRKIMKGARV